MSLLVISEGLFFNTLTANYKYSPRNSEDLRQPIQMNISKKEKKVLNFQLNFWNLNQLLNFLK